MSEKITSDEKIVDESSAWSVDPDFMNEWLSWTTRDGWTIELPTNWVIKVRVLAMAGLPRNLMVEAIGIAMRREKLVGSASSARFNYFMGVAYNLFRDHLEETDARIAAFQPKEAEES